VVEAAAALAGTSTPVSRQLFAEVMESTGDEVGPAETVPTLAAVRRRAEDRAVAEALRHAAQNRRAAAKLLGISEAKLYRVLARLLPADAEQPKRAARAGKAERERQPCGGGWAGGWREGERREAARRLPPPRRGMRKFAIGGSPAL
jgi:hypothetical protein